MKLQRFNLIASPLPPDTRSPLAAFNIKDEPTYLAALRFLRVVSSNVRQASFGPRTSRDIYTPAHLSMAGMLSHNGDIRHAPLELHVYIKNKETRDPPFLMIPSETTSYSLTHHRCGQLNSPYITALLPESRVKSLGLSPQHWC